MKIKCPAGDFEMPENLTFREMQQIKSITGLNPGQIPDALDEGDPMIVVAFVIIAAARSGKDVDENKILSWTLDDIEFGEAAEVEESTEDPTEA